MIGWDVSAELDATGVSVASGEQEVEKRAKADPFDVAMVNASVSIRPGPDKAYELVYQKVSTETSALVMVKVGTVSGKKANVMEPREEIELDSHKCND